jgi:hypothetical protein
VAIKNLLATAFAFASLSAPVSARAQSSAPAIPLTPSVSAPESSAPSAQIQEWAAELKQIELKLDGIEQQVLKDPAMMREQAELGGMILAAMIRIDPSVEARLARLKEILTEAQAPGIDEARLKALSTEVEQIHPVVANAQARALQDPAVDQRVRAYKDALDQHMAHIDPGAPQLIARRAELQKMITRAGR